MEISPRPQVWESYIDPVSGDIWMLNSETGVYHWATQREWESYIDPVSGHIWRWNPKTGQVYWPSKSDHCKQVESVVDTHPNCCSCDFSIVEQGAHTPRTPAESDHGEKFKSVVETHSQQQQQPSGLGERPSQARAKDEEPEQQQQRGTETSAADGPADAKQQQPGWKEAAGVEHLLWRAKWYMRNAVEALKALKALKAIIPEDEELVMMASWLVGGAEVMSGETKSSDHDAKCDQRQPQPDALETSAADAKQQQPGWTEAADVHQRHNKYLQLKAFYHWRSILRTQWIIDQQTPTQWIIAECMKLPLEIAGWALLYKAMNKNLALPTMRPEARRKNAEERADEDDMLADWLANHANIMSLRRYQKDTRYNKIGH